MKENGVIGRRESTDTHHAIETLWKIESPKVVASAARKVRDIGIAEELAQDALVAALERWPRPVFPIIQEPG
jgi:predicted RNA polymerase sigma factor